MVAAPLSSMLRSPFAPSARVPAWRATESKRTSTLALAVGNVNRWFIRVPHHLKRWATQSSMIRQTTRNGSLGNRYELASAYRLACQSHAREGTLVRANRPHKSVQRLTSQCAPHSILQTKQAAMRRAQFRRPPSAAFRTEATFLLRRIERVEHIDNRDLRHLPGDCCDGFHTVLAGRDTLLES